MWLCRQSLKLGHQGAVLLSPEISVATVYCELPPCQALCSGLRGECDPHRILGSQYEFHTPYVDE